MYIDRSAKDALIRSAKAFPIVFVGGARHVGKSAFLQQTFPNHLYFDLEDSATYAYAKSDPIGFLQAHSQPIILDGVQLLPKLISQIKVEADAVGEPGHFILCGSKNYRMMKSIMQPLAGRVGILTLLPLSYRELKSHEAYSQVTVEEYLIKGGYPALYQAGQNVSEHYFDKYVSDQLIKDAVVSMGLRNTEGYKACIEASAQMAGSLLNNLALARDLKINPRTSQAWLEDFVASYVIHLLPAYMSNTGKIARKTPKLYFNDTGLLCAVLGIKTLEELRFSAHRSHVLENAVVNELNKYYVNQAISPRLSFYRDNSNVDIAVIDSTDPKDTHLYAVKYTKTMGLEDTRQLLKMSDVIGVPAERRNVIYLGKDCVMTRDAEFLPFDVFALERLKT